MSYKENVLLELKKQNFYDYDIIRKIMEAITEEQITRLLLKNDLLSTFVGALNKNHDLIQKHLDSFWKNDFEYLYKEILFKCNLFIDLYIERSVQNMKIYNEDILFNLMSLIIESSMVEVKMLENEHLKMLDEINKLSR